MAQTHSSACRVGSFPAIQKQIIFPLWAHSDLTTEAHLIKSHPIENSVRCEGLAIAHIRRQHNVQCYKALSPSSVVLKSLLYKLRSLQSLSSIDTDSCIKLWLCRSLRLSISSLNYKEVRDKDGCKKSTETAETVSTKPVALCLSFLMFIMWPLGMPQTNM